MVKNSSSKPKKVSAHPAAAAGANGVTIRQTTSADGPTVRALITHILSAEFPKDQAAYPAADLDRIDVSYGGPRDAFLVAEMDGRIVGTCAVKQEGQTTALLRRLFVHQECRGRGIGGQLVEAAIAHCRAQGYRQMRIRTSDRMDTAIAVCLKKGFREDEQIHLGNVRLIRFTLRV